MTWDAIGSLAAVMVTFVGINLGALRWMLDRHRESALRESVRWQELERALFELRAALPLEYVRREDWIRFSGTLDAKFDAMRDEMRDEIGGLKEKLYV
jgi:hypothetical protein